MKLETYAAKQGAEMTDYTGTMEVEQQLAGWEIKALHTDENAEPVMLLVKSPRWNNYQVRNISSPYPDGRMLTEKEVKAYIKAEMKKAA